MTNDELIKINDLVPQYTLEKCKNCNGYGTIGFKRFTCPTCSGTGSNKIPLVPKEKEAKT